MHPSPEIEPQLIMAYNRWFTQRILAADSRTKSMIALPFADADARMRVILEVAEMPGVVVFMSTSQRTAEWWKPQFLLIRPRAREERTTSRFPRRPRLRGSGRQMNRFISVHSLSFVTCNMVHLTNWIMNGMPERFPKLNLIWIESGLAWLPFLMQRLDHEFLMRQSDAPLLRRLPSEYMREMLCTSQPPKRRTCVYSHRRYEASTRRPSCCTHRTGRIGISTPPA